MEKFCIFALENSKQQKHRIMFNKTQRIITVTANGTIEKMCHDILSHAGVGNIIKIAFFHSPCSDNEYLHNNTVLRNVVKERFPQSTPLVSYIAQKTASGTLTAEVTILEDKEAKVEYKGQYILLTKGDCREIISEGILPEDITASTFAQANSIFGTIAAILKENDFTANNIYRQWNYIQGITVLNDGSQNYQEFNDARSIFYSGCDWSNGYPAATGIGTSAGGVMIEFYAIKGEEVLNQPIDNPMQIAAHSYSQKVLDGKVISELNERTTPKFERARILGTTLYVSGTAAIKGEESNRSDSTIEQAMWTMEIMDNLISKENIPTGNNGSLYDILRLYVKREEEIPAVRAYMEEHYPTVPKHYLVADICRPELLIEIEGVAHI